MFKLFWVVFFLACATMIGRLGYAGEYSHKLGVGAPYIGAQIHWGFSERWALELRVLKGEADSTAGTVTGMAYGVRGYRYFRPPSRLRLYTGLEVAATRSYSRSYDYETKGMAFGGFGGTEIYLLKRLSIGLDAGPCFLSSNVRHSNTQSGEFTFVINTFLNFYFL